MGFQVSPGVAVSEIDLTTVVPAVSTTEGAISGVFRWGPVNQRVLVDSESNLVTRFGKPTNLNAETFFTAANFLSYGNQLYVVRAADDTPTASANVGANAYISVVNGIPHANASMFVANSGVLSAVGTTGSVTLLNMLLTTSRTTTTHVREANSATMMFFTLLNSLVRWATPCAFLCVIVLKVTPKTST